MALKRLDLYQIYRPASANKPAQVKTEPDKPVFNAISPYEIASFVAENPDADLKNIWNQLGIRRPNFGYDSISEEQQGAKIDRFLSKCNYCDVETYSCDLDGEEGKEVLLKLSDLLAQSCRYLVFKAIYGSDGGLSDEDFIKYNYDELSKIALSREDNRRVWLRMYLSQCE